MEIGIMTSAFPHRSLEGMLDWASEQGTSAVELGTGAYPGSSHCDVDRLLEDDRALQSFRQALADRDIRISALACHGNPLHPNIDRARKDHLVFERTVLLARKLELDRITLFSGCPGGPGDSDTAGLPNWVTCAWPPDYQELLEWQWRERVIPYWREAVSFARRHGVTRLCIEMHPGFVVYNPPTLLRLREAVGEEIGANFDPSHLFWQGIDVLTAVRSLGSAIFHVHGKDTGFNGDLMRQKGVLDTVPFERVADRSWSFRSIGDGHEALLWRQLLSVLRQVGYDDVISIEQEDELASPEEGVRRAIAVLRSWIVDGSAKCP